MRGRDRWELTIRGQKVGEEETSWFRDKIKAEVKLEEEQRYRKDAEEQLKHRGNYANTREACRETLLNIVDEVTMQHEERKIEDLQRQL